MNAPPIDDPTFPYAAPQPISHAVRFGLPSLRTSPPCGIARFVSGLARALSDVDGSSVSWIDDAQVAEVDVVILQYDDNATCGDLVGTIGRLRVPSIVVVHAIPKSPVAHQLSALEAVAAAADHLVVMSEGARQRLYRTYDIDRRKVTTIPHGATLPTAPRVKRPSRPIILTWGLLRPGKGIERVIDAMPSLADVPGRPRYLVAGPMDPRTPVADAEAYRDARIEQARRLGVLDSVSFDPRYYDNSSLAELIQQASVVAVPDDSTDQVSSGVLADALANGRPIVATAFPYAAELLGSGAGLVVDHDDPVALAAALRRIITQPRLAGSMASEVRQRAWEVAWPAVAARYRELAQRVRIAERATT